jgi:hypothetical protein
LLIWLIASGFSCLQVTIFPCVHHFLWNMFDSDSLWLYLIGKLGGALSIIDLHTSHRHYVKPSHLISLLLPCWFPMNVAWQHFDWSYVDDTTLTN